MKTVIEKLKQSGDIFLFLLKEMDGIHTKEECQELICDVENAFSSSLLNDQEKLELEIALNFMAGTAKVERNIRCYTQPLEILSETASSAMYMKALLTEARKVVFSSDRPREALGDLERIAEWGRAHPSYSYLCALALYNLGILYMNEGNYNRADECFNDAATYARRTGPKWLYVFDINAMAVLKKRRCHYVEAEELLRRAARVAGFGLNDPPWPISGNLGIIKMKLGDWEGAEHCFLSKEQRIWRPARFGMISGLASLRLKQRRFSTAEEMLESLDREKRAPWQARSAAIDKEFLGELYMETGRYEEAREKLAEAESMAAALGPSNDVITEIKRRQANLYLLTGNLARARSTALECIRICKPIRDLHEMGAVLRILGETYDKMGLKRKAASAFEAAITTLKSIHECYELMRSSLAYGNFLLSERRQREAELYLLEAKKLCEKVKIDYYLGLIAGALGRCSVALGDFREAQAKLREIEAICETLSGHDRKQVRKEARRLAKRIEEAMLRASIASASKLRVLGRIYEEARFPLEEQRPELALMVARTVGARSLFLFKKNRKMVCIPVRYDISHYEAAKLLCKVENGGRKSLSTLAEPRIETIANEKVVCIPGTRGYVLCTLLPADSTLGPKELEFLMASVEAMERLAEEYPARPRINESPPEGTGRHPGGSFREIITVDPEFIKLIRLAERASRSDIPILLQGETGSGKELMARAIHNASPRREGPFVAINTGGIPVAFLESQLFGHVKGAFTDAKYDREGLVDAARGGTLFLDEVGEMGAELQVKLLRMLENGEYRRLGENTLRRADVRVISATNRDLPALAEKGLFREDLYYRLAPVRFTIPPLRDRRGDVEILVRHFLEESLNKMDRPAGSVDIDMKAMEAFERYAWPGNVRELQNEVMRLVSLIDEGETIRFSLLSDNIKNYFRKREDRTAFERMVERFERRLILKALEENDWNRMKTAEKIGIPRTTLVAKIKRLDIAS